MEWCPKDTLEGEFQSVAYRHESASMAPKWKLTRRRTIWLTCKGFGCIRVAIREVKMEIPVRECGEAMFPRRTPYAGCAKLYVKDTFSG